MIGYIYMIKNKVNGKIYIGKTKNYKIRVMNHFSEAKNGTSFAPLHKDIRTYGLETFYSEVLKEIELEDELELIKELNKYEDYYMDYYDTIKNGYNVTKNHLNGSKTGTQLGSKNHNLGKIIVYNKDGSIYKIYSNRKHLCNELNIHKSTLSNCLANRKKHSKGFIFKYESENLDMNEYKDVKFITRSKRNDYTDIIK